MHYFFFGTLRDRDILEAVIDRPIPAEWAKPATLEGFRLVQLREEGFPALVPHRDGAVDGIVVDWLIERDLQRILFFESVDYASRDLTVVLIDGEPVDARIFSASGEADHTDEPWHFESWVERKKEADLGLTRLWMAFFGLCDVETANRLWDEAMAEGRLIEQVIEDLRSSMSAPRHRRVSRG
jgi:hypothetical protein